MQRNRSTAWAWGLILAIVVTAPTFAEPELDSIEAQVAQAARHRSSIEATLLNRWQSAAQERGVDSMSWQVRMTRQLRRASARQLAAALHAANYEDFLKAASGAVSSEAFLRGSAEATETVFGDSNKNLTYTPIVPCRIVDTRRSGTPGEVGIVNVGQQRQWDARGTFDFSFQGGDISCPRWLVPVGRPTHLPPHVLIDRRCPSTLLVAGQRAVRQMELASGLEQSASPEGGPT